MKKETNLQSILSSPRISALPLKFALTLKYTKTATPPVGPANDLNDMVVLNLSHGIQEQRLRQQMTILKVG